jgi:hypothetical protein
MLQINATTKADLETAIDLLETKVHDLDARLLILEAPDILHIGINFKYQHDVTGSAGAILAENWNNGGPDPYQGWTTIPLIDSTGYDSGATLISTGGGSYHTYAMSSADPQDGAHGSLFFGTLNSFGEQTVTISNIPSLFQSQGYELRIYHNNFASGNFGFRVEDGTGYSKTYFSYQPVAHDNYPLSGTDPFDGESGYIGSQNESNTHTIPSNYTFFDGLSGKDLTIFGVDGGTGFTRCCPCGFQLTTRRTS